MSEKGNFVTTSCRLIFSSTIAVLNDVLPYRVQIEKGGLRLFLSSNSSRTNLAIDRFGVRVRNFTMDVVEVNSWSWKHIFWDLACGSGCTTEATHILDVLYKRR